MVANTISAYILHFTFYANLRRRKRDLAFRF